jgi:hypothetical protein
MTEAFATNLASAASGLVSIGLALLGFVAARTRAPSRTELGTYAVALCAIMALAVYTAAADLLAWWAWGRATDGNPKLLFGWRLCVWLGVLFVPPLVFAAGVFLDAVGRLIRQVYRRRRESFSA